MRTLDAARGRHRLLCDRLGLERLQRRLSTAGRLARRLLCASHC